MFLYGLLVVCLSLATELIVGGCKHGISIGLTLTNSLVVLENRACVLMSLVIRICASKGILQCFRIDVFLSFFWPYCTKQLLFAYN